MSGFQKLSDLAPITMTMLSNPQKTEGETDKEYARRIGKILKKKKKEER